LDNLAQYDNVELNDLEEQKTHHFLYALVLHQYQEEADLEMISLEL